MQVVTDQDFSEVVEQAEGLVVVDFWADWCGPCRQMLPIMEQIESEYNTKMKFVKASVDEAPDAAAKEEIKSIPVLILYENGIRKDAMVGFRCHAEIANWLDGYLKG